MDAATLFGSANVHFVNEEYEEALKHYTCAVTLQDCAEYRACRAACHLKLGNFAQTLEDIDQAVAFEPKSHIAFYWRGIALFYMADFAGAKQAFEASIQAAPQARAPRNLWIRKCDAELSGSTLPLGSVAAEATKVPAVAATHTPAPVAPAAPMPAQIAAQAVPAAPAAARTSEVTPQAATSSAPQSTVEAKQELSISGRKQVRREWYQNTTQVFVTVFAKEVNVEQCEVDFQEKGFSLNFPLPGSEGEEYALDVDLFDAIDPSACKIEVSKVKVEICLQKKNVGTQWKDLEKQEEVDVPYTDQPAYPTSNKAKKDWGKIDVDMEKELKNEKPEGEEALNKLFKEIYERADPETRRAMNKSFQTSGGTVLSTNWGEVSTSDYEGKDRPTPPEGQEWRDWKNKK